MARLGEETALGGRFSVPAVSEGVVPLDAVSRRLSDAVGRVAVVTAPAGYGKTSQVAAWAHSDGRPVAWATIDRWSNDPDHFLSLLLGMLQHVTGVDPGEFASPPVDAEQYETVVASSLGRLVRDCPAPFVLVLDDAHIVDQAPATDLLRTVVDNVPPVSTVVLIARTVPHASLARLRVYAGLVDVSMDDLKLDGDGAQQLLGSMGVTVADEFVEPLVEQTEGWPVGIRMVAVVCGFRRQLAAVVDRTRSCRRRFRAGGVAGRDATGRGGVPDTCQLPRVVVGADVRPGVRAQRLR